MYGHLLRWKGSDQLLEAKRRCIHELDISFSSQEWRHPLSWQAGPEFPQLQTHMSEKEKASSIRYSTFPNSVYEFWLNQMISNTVKFSKLLSRFPEL